jgi:type I restriction enzyme, S subunit
MTLPVVPLAEVAEVQGGIQKQPKRAPQRNAFPFLRVANVTAAGLDLNEIHEIELFNGELDRYRLRRGDLLVVEGNGSASQIGRAAVWDGSIEDAVHQNHLIRVRPAPNLDERYLGLLWNSPAIRDELARVASSTSGLHTLSVTKLKRIMLPVPALVEQRRIVDLLEDTLSRLDAAEVYLDAALRRAEMLRWRSVAEAVSRAGGHEVRLGDIASVRNGIFVSRPGSEPNGVPILRIGAVRSLTLDLSELRYSERTEEDLREADGLAQPGDLLFTRYNGNPRFVGACVAVPEDAPVLTYPDKLIRVRVTDDAATSEFVALACSVGAARTEIQASVRTTAGQAGIAGRDLKNVTLKVPDLEAQRTAIVVAGEARIATDRLSRELDLARRRAVALRRSLLSAAFSGRLTSAESDPSDAEQKVGARSVTRPSPQRARIRPSHRIRRECPRSGGDSIGRLAEPSARGPPRGAWLPCSTPCGVSFRGGLPVRVCMGSESTESQSGGPARDAPRTRRAARFDVRRSRFTAWPGCGGQVHNTTLDRRPRERVIRIEESRRVRSAGLRRGEGH